MATFRFLFMSLTYLLTLGVLIPGLVLTARARRTVGGAGAKGMVGCAVLLGSLLLQIVWTFGMGAYGSSLYRSGSISSVAFVYGVFGLVQTVLYCIGVGFLIAGVVQNGRTSGSQPGQPYPGQPFQAQTFPGQPNPGQPMS